MKWESCCVGLYHLLKGFSTHLKIKYSVGITPVDQKDVQSRDYKVGHPAQAKSIRYMLQIQNYKSLGEKNN